MKTAEEILIAWHNPPFGLDTKTKSEITNAMKEFALEVAKEALRNAAKVVNWNFNGGHDCKQAILSETNIPKI